MQHFGERLLFIFKYSTVGNFGRLVTLYCPLLRVIWKLSLRQKLPLAHSVKTIRLTSLRIQDQWYIVSHLMGYWLLCERFYISLVAFVLRKFFDMDILISVFVQNLIYQIILLVVQWRIFWLALNFSKLVNWLIFKKAFFIKNFLLLERLVLLVKVMRVTKAFHCVMVLGYLSRLCNLRSLRKFLVS